ncbi:hypothetical protein CAPTEDRAFT_200912 [Capitella teleta]|uniref:Uncharacterized protein n=1 Tax=Capitella teleta TaxID=283909 RepID=R7UXZ3_CAPTE|nr:hypothetical protein CAPTEDRAFT_200912 [Capitella teleta]|eukprot:ELU11142.1 hypothetical protein CAPTEDRAFT_200912 [Capitella teleta]
MLDPVLAYIAISQQTSSNDHIANTMNGFYSTEEIVIARDILWQQSYVAAAASGVTDVTNVPFKSAPSAAGEASPPRPHQLTADATHLPHQVTSHNDDQDEFQVSPTAEEEDIKSYLRERVIAVQGLSKMSAAQSMWSSYRLEAQIQRKTKLDDAMC